LRAKLYIYPYRIAERKPHPILWSFDKEALNEIAKRFENKSVFQRRDKGEDYYIKVD